MSQVVVSTECPTCSGPLDFSEGINAIRCPSCGSTLLITGRKQVLSYWVAPTVKADVAGAVARTGRLRARVAGGELFFVPFYRLTGHDFQWQDTPPKPAPQREAPSMLFAGGAADRPEIELELGSILSWGADTLLGTRAGDVLRDVLGEPRTARPIDPVSLTTLRATKTSVADSAVQFLDRYVEKSFPAVDLPGFCVASLGVRTQALRVSLFQRDRLAALGTIVGIRADEATALRQGLAARGFEHVVYRQVLGRILSVIYFPFWVLEMTEGVERWLTVVDAVAESIVQPHAPIALRETLVPQPDRDLRTVGLRPLICPNCGWALPLEADDVIFFCASCSRAWQIHGVDLTEMAYEIADAGAGADPTVTVHLPFWRLDSTAAGAESAWVPAFRCRRLKILHDLALRFTAKPPVYQAAAGERPSARGCFYDAEDAILLARFTSAGRRRTPDAVKAAADDEPGFTGARLIWIPFKREGQSLIDPYSGLALQEMLLD